MYATCCQCNVGKPPLGDRCTNSIFSVAAKKAPSTKPQQPEHTTHISSNMSSPSNSEVSLPTEEPAPTAPAPTAPDPPKQHGRLDLKNPKRSAENTLAREELTHFFSEENEDWRPYAGQFLTKAEFQSQSKEYFADHGIAVRSLSCNQTRVTQNCTFCQALLLEAKVPTQEKLAKEKKALKEDQFNQPTYTAQKRKVMRTKLRTFRLSPPSFQHNKECALFKSSVLQKKVDGVHLFDVPASFYTNPDLISLAEDYSQAKPFHHSYDLIAALPGQGEQDKDRYFTSFFVQDQISQVPGLRELETLEEKKNVLDLYKAYCQEKNLSLDGLDGDITPAITEQMTEHFEKEVSTINTTESICELIKANNFTVVIQRTKATSPNSKLTIPGILSTATIPLAPVSFLDMCRHASIRRRMAGAILPFERWTHQQEMLTQIVNPEHGVKADSERVSLIRFLYQKITHPKEKAPFATQYSRIMFDIHKFLCYDCGLEAELLGPTINSRNTLERNPKLSKIQLSIAGFLKGGTQAQSAHRDVKGMNSAEPKPLSGSILVVLKGTRRLQIRGTVHTLSPGQAVWFDGDVVHNGMDNEPISLALHMHIDDNSFFRVAYDFDLAD
jgi:hypothetical protein